MPDTPIEVGDKRFSVTHKEDGYLSPMLPLKKGSPGSHIHELARISDLVGENRYRGVIWMGERTGIGDMLDTQGNPIGGYLFFPYNDLGGAYAAALSRFGTPSTENRILIVAVNVFLETSSIVNFSNKFIDFLGIGETYLAPTSQGENPINISSGGGHFLENFTLLSRNSGIGVTSVLDDPLEFRSVKFRSEVESGNTGLSHITLHDGIGNGVLEFTDIDARLVRRSLVRITGGSSGNGVRVNGGHIRKAEGSFPIFSSVGSFPVDLSLVKISRAPGTNSVISATVAGAHVSASQSLKFLNVEFEGDTANEDFRLVENYSEPVLDWKKVTSNTDVRVGTRNVSGGNPPILNLNHCDFGGIFENVANLKDLDGSIKNSSAARWRFTSNRVRASFSMRTCHETTSGSGTVFSTVSHCYPRLFNCNFRSKIHDGNGVFAGIVKGGSSLGVGTIASIQMGSEKSSANILNHVLDDETANKTNPPELRIAGSGYASANSDPIIISGVHSKGILETVTKDWSEMPDRFLQVMNSSFTLPSYAPSIPTQDRVTTAVLPGMVNPGSKVFLTDVQTLPPETHATLQDSIDNHGYRPRAETEESWIKGFLKILGFDADLVQMDNPRAFMEGAGMMSTFLNFTEGEQFKDVYDPRIPEFAVFNFSFQTTPGIQSQLFPVAVEFIDGSIELGLDSSHRVIRFTLKEPVSGVESVGVLATTMFFGTDTNIFDTPDFSDPEVVENLKARGYLPPE